MVAKIALDKALGGDEFVAGAGQGVDRLTLGVPEATWFPGVSGSGSDVKAGGEFGGGPGAEKAAGGAQFIAAWGKTGDGELIAIQLVADWDIEAVEHPKRLQI